ncbi:hypothetical protein L916_03170 [Phytophthora nicotianae]|uniref:Uncharacterized protein n=1 Tax=Phytophthora nicotianae TaxID=4792 RepID=W2JKU7_PHYNI|nr:hypothetical protein L916_03170 [Phytophthora nicotianae]
MSSTRDGPSTGGRQSGCPHRSTKPVRSPTVSPLFFPLSSNRSTTSSSDLV